jgi:hypothetical protein
MSRPTLPLSGLRVLAVEQCAAGYSEERIAAPDAAGVLA